MSKASGGCLQPKAHNWVPLFLSFVAARQTHETVEQLALPHEDEQNLGSDSDSSDSDSEPTAANQQKEQTATKPPNVQHVGEVKSTQMQSGSAHPSGASRVAAKAWRVQLKEWLLFIAGVKGVAGGFRAEEVRRSVVRQVQDTDSSVQQAALRCLKVSLAVEQCHLACALSMQQLGSIPLEQFLPVL